MVRLILRLEHGGRRRGLSGAFYQTVTPTASLERRVACHDAETALVQRGYLFRVKRSVEKLAVVQAVVIGFQDKRTNAKVGRFGFTSSSRLGGKPDKRESHSVAR